MIKEALQLLAKKWNSYKYRFVPWVALNLRKNERTLRQVEEHSRDKLISDKDVSVHLLKLFQVLFQNSLTTQVEAFHLLPPHVQSAYQKKAVDLGTSKRTDCCRNRTSISSSEVMLNTLGFCIDRAPSSLPTAGTGVFVTKGSVPKGAMVSMYPGTVYQPYEPVFFQSLYNPFIFRCIDGILIDGNDKGISKTIFRSCLRRDRLGPFLFGDETWLTEQLKNPLAVGQYVNNCTNEKAANVCYQEFDVPADFPVELRQYMPNVNYSVDSLRTLRCVVLVALRDITQGEELFSNYYTVVHSK
ncbi:SET domain-containing protein 9 [Erpetoichthys calabaricus]|uniref:SET domain-containing protein 9 n=1 Tax=Erpetoichthys calabaricus TaxID=27687 RepID=UPI0022343D3E|nr:SET domain-containing protein 9 [Erpetoichthys calabaricus]